LTTADVVTQAMARTERTGERLGDVLVAMGAISTEDMLRALARQLNLPYLSRDELPSPLPILKNLSPKYLRQYAVCPVSVEGGQLTVAIADPLNPLIADDLRQSTGLEVKLVVSHPDAITEAIDRSYEGAATPLQRIVEGMDDDRTAEVDEDVNHLRDMAFEAPVVRLVNLLVRMPSTRARPTSTSSPSRTPCASGTASTGSSSSRRPRPGASRRRSPRASRSWPR
jgi:general secretion pathway protein E